MHVRILADYRGVRVRSAAVALLLVLIAPTHANAQNQALTGVWTDAAHTMEVEFFECGDAFCGKILGLQDGEDRLDVKNPNSSLRDRPLLGLQIFSNLTYEGNGLWSGGTIYAPKKGIFADVMLRLTGRDDLEMTVSKLFLRRKAKWTRVRK